MYIIENLKQIVFDYPYKHGYRKLRILTGYASSAFLNHILELYPDIELDLIIGMSKSDGISSWDHERFIQIMNWNPNIQVYYRIAAPHIHTKVYHWYMTGFFDNSITFVGSANFSWGGFRDQEELLVEANFSNIDDVFTISDLIPCTAIDADMHINFYNVGINNRSGRLISIKPYEEGNKLANIKYSQYVDLPLLTDNDSSIQEKAGLNWGQRPRREPNQAYIKVPTSVHRLDPDFFPPRDHQFTLITDDGQQMICVVAQEGRKALETSENNSYLGIYFRNRLGVPLGYRVDPQDVLNYGRTSVRIFKIDSETYFMDFSV